MNINDMNTDYGIYSCAIQSEENDVLNVGISENEEKVFGVPKRFIRYFDEEPYILYAGLISLSNKKGIKSLTVEKVQEPRKENDMVAEYKARLVTSRGKIYEDYGDASPESVAKKIAPHIRRMASTRAKARVLRDFLAIGLCAYEELDLYNVQLEEGLDPRDVKGSITDGQYSCIFRNRKNITSHEFSTIDEVAEKEIKKLSQNEADKIIKQLTVIWQKDKERKENLKHNNSSTYKGESEIKSSRKEEKNNKNESAFINDAKENYIKSLAKQCAKLTSKNVEDVINAIKKDYETLDNPNDSAKVKVRENVVDELVARLKKGTIFAPIKKGA